ncbi:nuclear transport factor 2 family protein [Aquimarina sp. U1-2]|uniref:rhodanese-like domain-containing protein n=1 Tax=Aquimarina sp. U1-2 TaxID=2823141 RepID=UPI001AEC7C6A|nr:rhodanese-like domain-containing protein [Aquimarina sp. U1-2]MBP2833329.1 nuclear transport factor 2 family protein [Aquimarina sp. U1-2]
MKELITTFFTALNEHDVDAMMACYHEDIIFEDPIFGTLSPEHARKVWYWLCEHGKDLTAKYRDITIDGDTASVYWEARYSFGPKQRPVLNKVRATFEFKEGKISKHTDHFSLKRWAAQAMGWKGKALGGTLYFKKKLQHRSALLLDKYIVKPTSTIQRSAGIKTPLVSVQWLSDHLDDPDLIILDATIKKIASANAPLSNVKIKNALFFDIKNTFSDMSSDLPNMLPSAAFFEKACRTLGIQTHHKIVVYDQLGIYSSPRVWWMFKAMGHKDVAVLDGGLPAWKYAQLPSIVETRPVQRKRGNFRALYQPDLVVSSKEILKAIGHENTAIIDARSEDRFLAKVPEPREDLKRGHIPTSINLPYTTVLRNGKMLPVKELQEIFTDLGIENKMILFTCGSGITACIILLAAALAGYQQTAVYDGSWSEWGQLDGVPITC